MSGAKNMTIRTDQHRLGTRVRQPESDLLGERRGFGLIEVKNRNARHLRQIAPDEGRSDSGQERPAVTILKRGYNYD
ncbi:hypothetical protein [Brevundimonas sp. NIBR10]|uniref:hypothetical protein n=1 Tax=Brevundimonas sp. NIBR10 TaxID=3015997 RepID=UPI0022F16754|nr:hypothetical protein [Brevundimonas sp. NIBR10]